MKNLSKEEVRTAVMTLQECKDQVAEKHYYSEWSKLCPNGNLEGVPDKWIDEVAELYASQFIQSSPEPQAGFSEFNGTTHEGDFHTEQPQEESPKPDTGEDVALECLLDRLDTLYLIDFNKKLIGFQDLEKATRAYITKYTDHVLSEYSQAYQLRQSALVNELYARITELEESQFKSQSEAQTEKPDFERIYITKCAQSTASNVWDKYVTPLQARIKELESQSEAVGWITEIKRFMEFEKEVSGSKHPSERYLAYRHVLKLIEGPIN